MGKLALAALAAVHLALTLWHSAAHSELGVGLPPLKLAYAYVVIVIAPPLAAALLFTRFARPALWVYGLAMLGSLLFATYHHYILISPDNIAHLPGDDVAAQASFVHSAGLSALVELAGVLGAAFALGGTQRATEPRA